jgi:uncharacterized protein (DUF1778 family)
VINLVSVHLSVRDEEVDMADTRPKRGSTHRVARATERFEFRVPAGQKQAIAAAAALLGMDASDFAREVLAERTEEVLTEHEVKTVVPSSYFTELVAALDDPVRPNAALRKALDRARRDVDADHLQS